MALLVHERRSSTSRYSHRQRYFPPVSSMVALHALVIEFGSGLTFSLMKPDSFLELSFSMVTSSTETPSRFSYSAFMARFSRSISSAVKPGSRVRNQMASPTAAKNISHFTFYFLPQREHLHHKGSALSMACSGCAQRREALIKAGKAVVKGEVKAAVAETASVMRSGAQDAGSVLHQATAAARNRLMRR